MSSKKRNQDSFNNVLQAYNENINEKNDILIKMCDQINEKKFKFPQDEFHKVLKILSKEVDSLSDLTYRCDNTIATNIIKTLINASIHYKLVFYFAHIKNERSFYTLVNELEKHDVSEVYKSNFEELVNTLIDYCNYDQLLEGILNFSFKYNLQLDHHASKKIIDKMYSEKCIECFHLFNKEPDSHHMKRLLKKIAKNENLSKSTCDKLKEHDKDALKTLFKYCMENNNLKLAIIVLKEEPCENNKNILEKAVLNSNSIYNIVYFHKTFGTDKEKAKARIKELMEKREEDYLDSILDGLTGPCIHPAFGMF